MKDWFLRFSTREQLALLVMGVVVLVYLVFVLLVIPIAEARRELIGRNSATADALVRVELGPELPAEDRPRTRSGVRRPPGAGRGRSSGRRREP